MKNILTITGCALTLAATGVTGAPPADIVKTVTITADHDSAWHAWSTEEGVTTFFSRAANIDLVPGGDYEILFFPDEPEGQRGAEDIILLAVEPMKRLVFTWTAPPAWPEIRKHRTAVEISLRPLGDNTTEISLRHTLWGEGPEWDEVNAYFEKAWDTILTRLEQRFKNGPVNWDNRQ
jgi:uncharacterized protein YndB with AHSA1/START domain